MTTDLGSEFVIQFSAALCELLGTVHSRSTAYRPQSSGQTQPGAGRHAHALRQSQQDNLDDVLPAADFAVNMHSKKPFRTRHFTSTMAGTPGCRANWLWVCHPRKTLLPMTS